MSSLFPKRPTAQPSSPEEIKEALGPWPSVIRNAIIGLITGMSPEITVQTQCPVEAGELWDLKYKEKLYDDLDILRQGLAVNTAAICAIARMVFIRRNTLVPSNLCFPIFEGLHQEHNLWGTEEESKDAQAVLDSINAFAYKHNTIGDIKSYDFNQYKELNDLIEEFTKSHSADVESGFWRFLLTEYIEYTRWILGFDPEKRYSPALLKNIVSYIFLEDIIPAPLIESNRLNLNIIIKALLDYRWNYDEDVVEVSAGPIVRSYNEIATESFDPIVSCSYVAGPVGLVVFGNPTEVDDVTNVVEDTNPPEEVVDEVIEKIEAEQEQP